MSAGIVLFISRERAGLSLVFSVFLIRYPPYPTSASLVPLSAPSSLTDLSSSRPVPIDQAAKQQAQGDTCITTCPFTFVLRTAGNARLAVSPSLLTSVPRRAGRRMAARLVPASRAPPKKQHPRRLTSPRRTRRRKSDHGGRERPRIGADGILEFGPTKEGEKYRVEFHL